MKLRNKKTGEIDDFLFEVITDRIDLYRRVGTTETKNIWTYNSLAELNEEWEDYKPAEPLIKDEKVRKAVRAWAEANDFTRVFYEYDYSNDVAVFSVGETKIIIEADELLDDVSAYTIAELCGEEE